MVEGDRLQEGLGGEPGPAAKQVMQVGGGGADRRGDFVDLRLLPPVLGDEGDCAPHHGVIVGCGEERRKFVHAIVRQHGVLLGHCLARYLGFVRGILHPIPGNCRAYCRTVRLGPRRASPRAAASALASVAFSVGPRDAPTGRRRPCDTRNSRSMPNSSCASRWSRTHTGLSVHSATSPRWLTLRTVSALGVIVTCS